MRLIGIFFILLLVSCSFEYGDETAESEEFPEITMENLEYVRVRDGKLTARLTAEVGERYESRHTMNLSNYTFEQYETKDEKVDAEGEGGEASIEMINNNIKMSEGVKIRVDSEDFSLNTLSLDWQDKTKLLKGGDQTPVNLTRKDGTELTGSDFQADIRSRSWVFGSDVHGNYVDDGEETADTEDEDSGENDTETP